jgi:hypothetical protein
MPVEFRMRHCTAYISQSHTKAKCYFSLSSLPVTVTMNNLLCAPATAVHLGSVRQRRT